MKTNKLILIFLSIISLLLISNITVLNQSRRINLHINDPNSANLSTITIKANNENYTVFETVYVTLNASGLISTDYYQIFLTANEQSDNKSIAVSPIIIGETSVNEVYSFNLSNYDLDVSDQGNTFYFYFYHNNLQTSIYTSIYVSKEVIKCVLSQNNTINEYGNNVNIQCTFISTDNKHYLNNTFVYYKVLNNGIVIRDNYSIQTNSYGIMNFILNTSTFQMIGNYSIYIFKNDSKYFMKFHFFYNFIVTPLKLLIKVQNTTPMDELVNKNNQSFILYPINIETDQLNGSLIYDPSLKLSIINNDSENQNFIDLKNGTYSCTFVLNNIKQNFRTHVISDSDCYSIINPNLTLNITKRTINFNKMFSNNQNFSNFKDIYFYVEIIDHSDDSYILGLNNLIVIQYFFNNEWNTLSNIPASDNQLYVFNISMDTLKFLNNKTSGPINFRFFFLGNSVFKAGNSSIFSVMFNISDESSSNLHNPSIKLQNIGMKILLISGLSSIPFISLPIIKIIKKKIKKKYLVSNLTL